MSVPNEFKPMHFAHIVDYYLKRKDSYRVKMYVLMVWYGLSARKHTLELG